MFISIVAKQAKLIYSIREVRMRTGWGPEGRLKDRSGSCFLMCSLISKECSVRESHSNCPLTSAFLCVLCFNLKIFKVFLVTEGNSYAILLSREKKKKKEISSATPTSNLPRHSKMSLCGKKFFFLSSQ